MSTELGALRRRLLAWYRREARDLPWRRTRDAYRIWVSEVMLQQTQVATVVPYYERFMQAFPTVAALAKAPLQSVLKRWEGLGYYARARNLHAAARFIVAQRGGKMPVTAADWQTLPGIGRYTAAAIASIAHHEPVAALDGNVARVLVRLFAVRQPIDSPTVRGLLWKGAQRLLAARRAGDFNQAMMELGARVCTPRNPNCGVCPLQRFCRGAAQGRAERLPVKRTRRAAQPVRAAAAAIEHQGRYLLVRRPAQGILGGLWQFPAVQLNGGGATSALRAHVRSRLRLDVRVGRQLATVRHEMTHRRLEVRVYGCACDESGVRVEGERWLAPEEFGELPMSVLDRRLAEIVLQGK